MPHLLKQFFILIGLFFLGLFQFSCRKTYSDPTVPYLFDSSPAEKAYMELNTFSFLPLPDNTFVISVKSTSYSALFREFFLHYDANFRLIDTAYYSDVLYFGKGIESNGSIFNVLLQLSQDKEQMKYSVLETDYNYKRMGQSANLMDALNIQPYRFSAPMIVQLENGTIVTAITSQVTGRADSIKLVAFTKGLNSAPLWMNDTVYWANGIKGIRLEDMVSDGNFFYLLAKSDSKTNGVLRKHDENGKLIWSIGLPDFYGYRILVQNDKLILFDNKSGMLYFDTDGNLLGSNSYKDYNLVSNGNAGFLGLNMVGNQWGQTTTITKYNSNLVPVKSRDFGDGKFHYSVLGKLHDGTFVLVTNMKIQNLGEQLVFYKLDADLNDYTK